MLSPHDFGFRYQDIFIFQYSCSMLLMIRPAAFSLNAQTAVNNYFQTQQENEFADIQSKALEEFDAMVASLKAVNVEVVVVKDEQEPHTPDSIFPNNWVSFHAEGYILYPMYAANRRLERSLNIWSALPPMNCLFDLSHEELSNRFLEGTGSMVLDRYHSIAYAALSPRTDRKLVEVWCEKMNYTPVIFEAFQSVKGQRLPIYHTNVMMSVGSSFALWCPESIDNLNERERVGLSLRMSDRELIEISESQLHSFAGNILQVFSRDGHSNILMSFSAEKALEGHALDALRRHGEIVACSIPTIEQFGGGSARCMVAEVVATEG